ncbi:OB-fold protein [Leptobacterium sp. I13]|uniref:OB-fold protein n=1 Tax=Leptobacterium meishanense TaxID=3128904 RepID=UPI0030EE0298
MKKKIIIGILIIAVIGLSYIAYLFFMPHRDVQATKAFAEKESYELVQEFLNDRKKANELYLDNEGESKVLIIKGTVYSINEDQLGQKVVLLKREEDKMGVSVTFMLETNNQLKNVKIGNVIKVKGVIRSGAEYDEDLDLAEHVIVEKAAIAY